MSFYSRKLSEVLEVFGTDEKRGLTGGQASAAKKRYGPNKLNEKKKTSLLVRFLMQFNDFMIIILLTAAAVSFFVSYLQGETDFIDPIIILAIVTLNALLGLIQESRAEKAIEALKKLSSPTSKAVRDGKLSHISTEELVPGDLIILETGDLVPADARLISSVNLKMEESALTGESLPSEKDEKAEIPADTPIGDRKNMVFSGSSVSYGRGAAIVVETGMQTEVGKIAAMILTDEHSETPLQRKLAETGKILGIGAVIICAAIFMLGLLRQMPPLDMFMTSVGLAVAAIPEGLPAIVTIMLAIGVQRMAIQGAVIRKLPAVETLGRATVICSDKTGTLTQNKMKVVELADAGGTVRGKDRSASLMLKLASLCNDCLLQREGDTYDVQGDPTERAFVVAALQMGLNKNELEKSMARLAEVPFDSKRKLMTTVHNSADCYISITKGAPDVLLSKCTYYIEDGEKIPFTAVKRRKIMLTNSQMAEKALRVLAVAYRELPSVPMHPTAEGLEKELIFAGLIGMIDPPREEVRRAVEICSNAGIRPVMITGDHIATAVAIAQKTGIMNYGDRAITGAELSEISQEDLSKTIYNYSVFARVSPEHKARIIKAFQSRGEIVAMTGDGVNDAPALKMADIGCAMGISGTDVAKGAADMVLTDDNFATIVEAVREGRGIFSNIRKSAHFLLSSNIGEILTILTAMLFGLRSPLVAIQLLWVNLVTDSLPAIALGMEPVEADIMQQKPDRSRNNLFTLPVWAQIGFEGCMIGLLSLIAFITGARHSYAIGSTMAFATLSISQLVHSFNLRSRKSVFEIDLFENAYLIGAFIVGVILQVFVIMVEPVAKVFKVVPLAPRHWIVIILLCLMPIVISEFEKYWNGRENFILFKKVKSNV